MSEASAPGIRPGGRGSLFLTGATGFIGYHLQGALLADGWQLRTLTRVDSPRASHIHPGANVVYGTLTDEQALARGLAGATALINCAGSVRGRTYADFEAANVAGMEALCAVLSRMHTRPVLLHLSSLAAQAPELSDYARSKREGERVLESHTDLEWTIFRPPAVYGPGDRELTGLFRLARLGVLVVPGGDRRQRLSFLHVDDLVEAVRAWLRSPELHLQRHYALQDGHVGGYDWDEIAEACVPNGRRRLYLPLPTAVLQGVAAANEALARVTGRAIMLSRGKVRELTRSAWVGDNSAFSRASGWTPRISLAEGVNALFESDA